MAQSPHSALNRHRSKHSDVALARTAPTNALKSRNGGRRYSDEEIELALTTLVLNCGNVARTVKALAESGFGLPESTLRYWRSDLYADRYRDLDEAEVPRRYGRAAESFEAVVARATAAENRLLDKLEREEDQLPTRDVAGALRNVATTKGINQDKALLLRGRPTEIKATADVTDVLKSLAKYAASRPRKRSRS